ncbi:MAG TPA: tail fiber domain-containing protein, partial [Terriglobales bacterium]|nr:tail fiber domain-containing protein [Terriglobales bacterium]
CVVVGLLSLVLSLAAQTSSSSFASAQVPPFIQFSGVAGDVYGKPLTGVVGVTFYLYQEQQGGAPLWMETQNVQPDKTGHYSVLLGSTTSQGLPASIFTSGEAHWLGVQVQGQDEQPRVLLVSAPYALKAGDAETLGGKSLSAFVLNETQATASSGSSAPTQTAVGSNPKTSLKPGASPTVGGSGTTDYVAKFTNSTTLGNSLIFDNGTNVGIGTTSPAAPLHISGNRLLLTSGTTAEVQFTGSASSARFGEDATGSFFASDTNGKVVKFLTNNGTLNEWMRITSAGNVGIGTTTPAAKLEVKGGDVSVDSGNLDLPQTTGATQGVITMGGSSFIHACCNSSFSNTNVGAFAGNFGGGEGTYNNTAIGAGALKSNTAGNSNTAVGVAALGFDVGDSNNTAVGFNTLIGLQAGNNNTQLGSVGGGQIAFSGSYNTFLGSGTGSFGGTLNSTTTIGAGAGASAPIGGSVSNATAIGANALVTASNSLVLGSIIGVNGATSNVNVGIGTIAPTQSLEIDLGNEFIRGLDNFQNPGDTARLFLGDTNNFIQSQNGFGVSLSVPSQSFALNILNGGDVGIGTISPDSLLSVNGTADKPGGGSWGTFSDGRLKILNGSFSSGLSQVLKIHPVRYRYKPDNAMGIRDMDEHIGVVAQEVQRVIPEAVTENSRGYLLVNNDPIIWTMLNAIQEQQREIRDLKSELRATRQTLQKVKAQVSTTQPRLVAAR